MRGCVEKHLVWVWLVDSLSLCFHRTLKLQIIRAACLVGVRKVVSERVPKLIHKLPSLQEVCQHLNSWLYGCMYGAAVYIMVLKRRWELPANYDNCVRKQDERSICHFWINTKIRWVAPRIADQRLANDWTLCLQNISPSYVYITSLLTTTIDYSMNTKRYFGHDPLHVYRLIFQHICRFFIWLNMTKAMLRKPDNTSLFWQSAAYTAYWVTYQLPRTSVHLKSITDRKDGCFDNQRQLYMARNVDQ